MYLLQLHGPPSVVATSLWVKADEGVIKTSNSVTSWTDFSGNSRNLTVGLEGTSPLYVENALNTKPIIRFDGNTNYLTNTGTTGVLNSTIFAVMKLNSGGASEDIIVSIGTDRVYTASRHWYRQPNSTKLDFTSFWGTALSPTNPDFDIGNYHIFCTVQDGSNVRSNRDGDLQNSTLLTDGASTTGNDSRNGWNIGSLYDTYWSYKRVSGYATAMDMAEVIIYASALSDSDRQKTEGYLAHKWGLTANLPVDHPYKNSPPTI